MPDDQRERHDPSELVETASAVGGALAGTALTLVAGPFVGSASGEAVARVLLRVGTEIERRLLGPRQEQRIADAYAVAADEISQQLGADVPVRADGFFEPPDAESDSPAYELLEGTLRTAADAWEQRKVPYIGRIFGRLSFDESVSPSEASYLLKLADRVTYRQLVLLAFWEATQEVDPTEAAVSRRYEHEIRRLAIHRAERGGRPTPSILAEMDDLGGAGLLGVFAEGQGVAPPGGTWGSTGGFVGVDLDKIKVTDLGHTLHRMMGLEFIPDDDLDAVLTAMRGGTPD